MTLNWVGHHQVIGALTAVGLRGTYCVQQIGAAWWLQGCGHDGLRIPALPQEGQPFAQLTDAQQYAHQLDQTTVVPTRPTVRNINPNTKERPK